MKLLRSLDDLPSELRSGAVSVGNFDGVHLGHARIIERLVAAAQRVSGPAVAFTFDPHPAQLLRPDRCPAPLTWIERRAELLGELGVDAVIAYPTDDALLQLTAGQFFESILRDRLGARAIVEGANFRFGHDRQGSVETLRRLGTESGVVVEVVDPVLAGGEAISSSRVRGLVAAGDVAAARRMLTRPFRIRGVVSRGAGRGAQLGFPTANLEAITTIMPAHGVYGGAAYVAAKYKPAAINIGPNPTFGEAGTKVEVHLIGFGGSLYGETLEVDFLDRLRDVQKFGSIDELKTQLSRDVRAAEVVAATNRQG